MAVTCSFECSNWSPAPAPLRDTEALTTMLTVKLPPVASGLIVGAPSTLMVLVLPVSAWTPVGGTTPLRPPTPPPARRRASAPPPGRARSPRRPGEERDGGAASEAAAGGAAARASGVRGRQGHA